MTKLTRFLATCVLVVSVFGAALADGGQTQGPNSTSPTPPLECSQGCEDSVTSASEPDPLADLATVATVSFTLLTELLF
jgi:hypothetical protein